MGLNLHDLPPPPYQPSTNPAATSARRDPVIFRIACPLQCNYIITSSSATINAHNHEWALKPDLVFHGDGRELASCDFKEKTLTADIAVKDEQTLWWSAMESDACLATKYRFMAKVGYANPLQITGFSVTSPRPFVWCREQAWKLVDELTGNVAAVAYDEEGTLGNPGTLEILMTYGETFSLIAVTSYVTLCEKMRREGKASRGLFGLH